VANVKRFISTMTFPASGCACAKAARAPGSFNTRLAVSTAASRSENIRQSTRPRPANWPPDLHAKVRLGQDPAGAKADARARANETFETCARQYLAWQQKRVRPSTYKENERHLLKNLAPLHSLRVDTTDKRSIAAQLTRLSTAAGPVQANRTRASLSKFFNWCLREGLVDANPAALTNVAPEIRRDRVLANDELAEIWKALPANDFGTILKLLILTGQRKREIAVCAGQKSTLTAALLPCRHTAPRTGVSIPFRCRWLRL
jgi:hypothetical protein